MPKIENLTVFWQFLHTSTPRSVCVFDQSANQIHPTPMGAYWHGQSEIHRGIHARKKPNTTKNWVFCCFLVVLGIFQAWILLCISLWPCWEVPMGVGWIGIAVVLNTQAGLGVLVCKNCQKSSFSIFPVFVNKHIKISLCTQNYCLPYKTHTHVHLLSWSVGGTQGDSCPEKTQHLIIAHTYTLTNCHFLLHRFSVDKYFFGLASEWVVRKHIK